MNWEKSIFLSLIIILIFSCEKMDSVYQEFITTGEIIYPAKPDSVIVLPGYNRVKLKWANTGVGVKTVEIFWDNRSDSLEIDLEKLKRQDTIEVLLENLEEKSQTFELFSYDNFGNRSMKTEAQGTIFGDFYRSTLLNRAIKDIIVRRGVPCVVWLPSEDEVLKVNINYMTNEGGQKYLNVPYDEDSTWLEGFIPGHSFTYSTNFLPVSDAIDTFISDVDEVFIDSMDFVVKESMLDKSLFQPLYLPTDTYEPNSATSIMDHIWDGDDIKEGPTFITKTTGTLPQWFTFDLGVSVKLTRLKMNQRGLVASRLYRGGNLKKYEIWGSSNPNQNGSWDESWILLAECKTFKPSGDEGPVTEEDVEYALKGEEFILDENAPDVRYIRIKTLENWDVQNRGYINIGQVTFWGIVE